MKNNTYRIFLALTSIEGAIALYSTATSQQPIIVRVVTALAWVLILSLIVITFFNSPWHKSRIMQIETFLRKDDNLLSVITYIVNLIIILIISLFVFSIPQAKYLGGLQNLFAYFQSAVIWLLVVFLQTVILVIIVNRPMFTSPGFVRWQIILRATFLFTLIFATLAHWLILIYRLNLFHILPGWFWNSTEKSFTLNDFLLLGVILISYLAIQSIFRYPNKKRRNIIILIAMGYFLQISFGFIEGSGFESIRLRYAATDHNSYAQHAADQPGLLDILTDYEARYADDIYTGTKPPGALFIYAVTEKVSNWLFKPTNFKDRFLRLTQLSAYLFPLIASLTVIPLYLLSKRFLEGKFVFLPSLFYIFSPNFILIPLFLDQVLYPLIFTSCVLLVIKSTTNRSLKLSILTGGLIYLAIFTSFSLLPILPITLIFVPFYYFVTSQPYNRIKSTVKATMKYTTGFLGGFFLLFILFQQFLNYNLFLRYTNAIDRHRSIKIFDPGISQIFGAAATNNIDYATWVSFPIALLAIAYILKSLAKMRQVKNLKVVNILTISVTLTYITLNIFGQTQGEVGRIWLFLVPITAFFASLESASFFKNKHRAVFLFLFAELITAYLIFKFQDFRA